MNNHIKHLVIVLLTSVSIISCTNVGNSPTKSNQSQNEIVKLSGTFYDMGYQYGQLRKDKLTTLWNKLDKTVDLHSTHNLYITDHLENYSGEDVKDFISGMAASVNFTSDPQENLRRATNVVFSIAYQFAQQNLTEDQTEFGCFSVFFNRNVSYFY